jgi:hypothetical protein
MPPQGFGDQSYIRWLSFVLFPHWAEERVMVGLKGYCDESGQDGQSRVLVVAGVLSPSNRWERFESEWKLVLASEHLDYFHAYDFYQRKPPFRLGTDWDSKTKRDHLIDNLISIVQSHVAVALVSLVYLEDYKQTFPVSDRIKNKVGTAYTNAGITSIVMAGRWADEKHYPREPIAFFFDSGHEHALDFLAAHRRARQFPEVREMRRLGGLTFDDDRRVVPIQAADLLAYAITLKLNENKRASLHSDWELANTTIQLFTGPYGAYRMCWIDGYALKDIRAIHEGPPKHH